MGSFSSKSIKFATANYSGITNSPFQFYSEDAGQELRELNDIFKTLFSQLGKAEAGMQATLKRYTNYDSLHDCGEGGKVISTKFNWNIGNVDRSMHRGRYSSQYRKDVGIQNGRLIPKDKYLQRWEFQFNKNVKYVKIDEPNPAKQELPLEHQKQICKVFDFLIYKTFVQYSYNKVFTKSGLKSEITIGDRDLDDSKQSRIRRKEALQFYEDLMDQFHDKPFLSHQLKFMKIKELYSNCDVVFLQDCSDQLINQIKNQGDITIIEPISPKGDSYILINSNRKPFQNLYDVRKFMKSQNEKGGDTDSLLCQRSFIYENSYPTVCLTDNFLLISLHFSSKKTNKHKQLHAFMTHLLAIHQIYGNRLKIIIGGDFNMNIKTLTEGERLKEYEQSQKSLIHKYQDTKITFWNIFKCYPNQQIMTSRKTRTWLQSQASKSEKPDQSERDFLISNQPLQKWNLIHNSVGQKAFLPTQKHPFDHFFISAELQRNYFN